jgi:hypothetical protein
MVIDISIYLYEKYILYVVSIYLSMSLYLHPSLSIFFLYIYLYLSISSPLISALTGVDRFVDSVLLLVRQYECQVSESPELSAL